MATKKKSKRVSTKKSTNKPTNKYNEPDTVFFLKLVVLLIVGSQWMFIENYPDWQIPIPVGLILGLVLVTHEHFQIDRKIEYAILLIAAFLSFWLPIGLVISV